MSGEYNFTALNTRMTEFLRGFPRFDSSLHRTDDTWAPTKAEYYESLGIIAGFFWIIGLITFILMVVITCCSCLPRTPKHYNFFTRNWPRLGLILTACLLAAAGILGIVSGLPLTFANKESLDIIIDAEGRILNDTNSIDASLAWLNRTDLFQADLQDFIQEVNSTYTWMQDNRSSIERDQYIGLMVLVALFAFGLFICIASCFTSVWSKKLSVCSLAFMIVLIYPVMWMMLSGGVPVGVFTADMCQDVHPYLMNQTSNNETRLMLNYYLECQGSNPFSEIVQFSESALAVAQWKLNETIANNGTQKEIAEIRSYIAELQILSVALVDITDCKIVSVPWKKVQDNVCTDMLDAFMVVMLACLLSIIALCFMCCFSMCSWERLIRERAGGYMSVNDDTESYQLE